MSVVGVLYAPVLLALLLVTLGGAMLYSRRRWPLDETPLVDEIDAALPQTQCAQCGYPGCRPYAQAVADGEAALDLCPPGGADTYARLVTLMGASAAAPPQAPAPAVAVINESECIGCTLCLPPCPVDAIVGAQGHMHTVLANECTGCELCIPACPVDCISLAPAPPMPAPTRRRPRPAPAKAPRACIHCGACTAACPVHLDAEQLLILTERSEHTEAAQLGLERCIECGLCDRVCPSDIPLAEHFATGKKIVHAAHIEQASRDRLKARHARHEARLLERADEARARRSRRLQTTRKWLDT